MIGLLSLTFGIGLVASLILTLSFLAIANRQATAAAVYELAASIVTIIAWQIWADTHNDWRVLASEAVGAATGTWLAVRYGK